MGDHLVHGLCKEEEIQQCADHVSDEVAQEREQDEESDCRTRKLTLGKAVLAHLAEQADGDADDSASQHPGGPNAPACEQVSQPVAEKAYQKSDDRAEDSCEQSEDGHSRLDGGVGKHRDADQPSDSVQCCADGNDDNHAHGLHSFLLFHISLLLVDNVTS